MNSHSNLTPLSLLFFVAIATTACQQQSGRQASEMTPEQKLSNKAIFDERLYDAEQPVASRWHPDGNSFTVLETNPAYEDAEREVDENGDLVEHPKDLVSYEFETLARTVILSADDLIPPGADKPLVIDDYAWSDDQSKLLLYTNSVRVWRVKSRGDYSVLDQGTGKLTKLGGPGARPSTMQFAKFSPDGSKVAYVREADIFVEDLRSGDIDKMTRRDNESIVNGIMSWAYEEEFSIRDGFRWSPDGSRIAYWQFDTSGVRDFMIINNTDALYPTITSIPYPKVGETISAARIGVVSLRTGNTAWASLPGDPRNNYIPRMQWADSSDELLLQHVNRKQDTNNVYLIDAKSGESRKIFTDQEQHYLDDFHDVEWLNDGRPAITTLDRLSKSTSTVTGSTSPLLLTTWPNATCTGRRSMVAAKKNG
jgi:dipeptidyl-peptidase-4